MPSLLRYYILICFTYLVFTAAAIFRKYFQSWDLVCFLWAGNTSGMLWQLRCAWGYIGSHQGIIGVEPWKPCLSWAFTYLSSRSAWQKDSGVFQNSAGMPVWKGTIRGAHRNVWGSDAAFECLPCTSNEGRLNGLVVSAGTYFQDTAAWAPNWRLQEGSRTAPPKTTLKSNSLLQDIKPIVFAEKSSMF